MSIIYALLFGGIVAVMLLTILCAIFIMITHPPSRIPPGTTLRHRDSGRNICDEHISQKSVPGGV